jgi:hypothetical protein
VSENFVHTEVHHGIAAKDWEAFTQRLMAPPTRIVSVAATRHVQRPDGSWEAVEFMVVTERL